MKTRAHASLIALVLATAPLSVPAYTGTLNNLNLLIPDNDLNGCQSSLTLSGIAGPVEQVSVTLNLAGGFNGDYYVYLTHNGASAMLLNRVGRGSASSLGYSDPGFGPNSFQQAFTFSDSAAPDVHWYRSAGASFNSSGQLTGTWQPDGRWLDPESAAAVFDGASRSHPLSVFNGMDPNGVWTLYLADVSPLGQGTLTSWGLTLVPEPSGAALGGLGLSAMLLGAWARRRGLGAAGLSR